MIGIAMHNYTRIFPLLVIFVMMLSLFIGSSCENGTGPEDEGTLVGTWQLAIVTLKDTPVGDIFMTAEQFLGRSGTDAQTSTLQLNEDGSASLTTTYTDGSSDAVDGSWSSDGDELTINEAGMDGTFPYELDRFTLAIIMIMAIDFDSDGTEEDIEIEMKYNRV